MDILKYVRATKNGILHEPLRTIYTWTWSNAHTSKQFFPPILLNQRALIPCKHPLYRRNTVPADSDDIMPAYTTNIVTNAHMYATIFTNQLQNLEFAFSSGKFIEIISSTRYLLAIYISHKLKSTLDAKNTTEFFETGKSARKNKEENG